MTITSHDMRDQIITTLDGHEDDYDVDNIVQTIIDRYGRCDIDDVGDGYWQIVGDHERVFTYNEAVVYIDGYTGLSTAEKLAVCDLVYKTAVDDEVTVDMITAAVAAVSP